jgi:alpha-tubulin suppressor-like RCC1 family protein
VSDAFCAILNDNRLVTWGDPDIGGKIATLANTIENIKDVSACEFGFSAVRTDGTVFTWGGVKQESNGQAVELSNVNKIFANSNSFVALKNDGTAVPYSDIGRQTGGVGEIFSDTPDQGTPVDLTNIVDIAATKRAFAAKKNNGSVVAWGNAYNGGDTSYNTFGPLTSVSKIYGRHNYFIAINNDGSVSTWGNIQQQTEDFSDIGSAPWYENGKTGLNIDPSISSRDNEAPDAFLNAFDRKVSTQLSLSDQFVATRDKKKYIDIISNPYASVALREDGFMTAWGDTMHGGRPFKNVFQITEDVNSQQSLQLSFTGNTITDVNGGSWAGITIGDSIRIQSSNEYGDGDYTVTGGSASSITVTNLDGSIPSFSEVTNSNVARVTKLVVTDVGENATENDYISFVSENDFNDAQTVISNYYSFAVLKTNNTVLTWGRKGFGGDSPDFDLTDGETISSIHSSIYAYAALTSEGRVIAWGKREFGGDVTFGAASSDGDTSLTDENNKVTAIYSGRVGFMATREDKSVVVWGDASLQYGIKIVGPEAVGIFGRRENYGLGYAIDLDYKGRNIVIGSRKKNFLNNAYPGSVKVFQRGILSSKWKRIGNTIRNTLFRNNGKIGFGKTVKINRDGSKIFAHRLAKKTVPVSPGDTNLIEVIRDTTSVYSFDGASWSLDDTIFFPDGHETLIPYTSNDDYALKINNYIAIDAPGNTVALGTPASGSLNPNTSNGEVNIYTLGVDGTYALDTTLRNNPLISGDDQQYTSGIFDDWTASTLFGENLSLSADGKTVLISRRDGAVVYNKNTIGYGEEVWQEKNRIYQYDNPKFPTYFNKNQNFESNTRVISAHMSSGGEYVSTTFLGANTQDQNHYAHTIYTLGDTLDRQDYDYLDNNYLAHFSSTIQKSGEYSQYLFTNDASLFNGQSSKAFGEFQSIARYVVYLLV